MWCKIRLHVIGVIICKYLFRVVSSGTEICEDFYFCHNVLKVFTADASESGKGNLLHLISVSSLNEEWETNEATSSNTVSGTQILEYTEFPKTRPFVEVYVSAIADPGMFWVQVVNHMALKLDELSVEMTRYFQNDGQVGV